MSPSAKKTKQRPSAKKTKQRPTTKKTQQRPAAKKTQQRPSRPLATTASQRREEQLYRRVEAIVDDAHQPIARTINTAMVHAYWLIGREIVLVEQRGAKRAGYGEQLLEMLGRRLTKRFGRGMGIATLRRARTFYQTFPQGSAFKPALGDEARSTALIEPTIDAGEIRSTALIESTIDAGEIRSTALIESTIDAGEIRSTALIESTIGAKKALFPPSLSWSHYLVLLRVTKPDARSFYEIEAARECWSVRELERQIGALLFERLSKNKKPKQIRALAREGQRVAVPSDVLKDPFVLEFVDLRSSAIEQERDLEQALIDRLEDFLLELGKGFCFVGRQRRITLEGDHFYVDLVFYNRLLRCFVLVDLKLGKLTHQDLGQMQMYVNYFDRFQRAEHEAKTIGIVLCSDKNDAMVHITLPDEDKRVIAARYQMYLPTEEELRAELEREREEAERVMRLTAGTGEGRDTKEPEGT